MFKKWMPLWLAAALWLPLCARAQAIDSVLQQSQQARFRSFELAEADSAAAATLDADFELLVRTLSPPTPVRLAVIRGDTLAETLEGQLIVVNERLAALPREERLFVVAHELGHVALRHWSQMGLLFQKWVPGAVKPQLTDPIAALLGREASGLAYQQEFEADAFAADTLERLGVPLDPAALFRRLGATGDTATHPATRKRLAALRAQAAIRAQAPVQAPD